MNTKKDIISVSLLFLLVISYLIINKYFTNLIIPYNTALVLFGICYYIYQLIKLIKSDKKIYIDTFFCLFISLFNIIVAVYSSIFLKYTNSLLFTILFFTPIYLITYISKKRSQY